ncbi:MAG: hypothetical protein IPN11_15335 [Opitutaceae bacterium]|nr:hypothetical protein [Opitutaceae bacterium]
MITESEFILAPNCPVQVLHERARLPRTDRTDSFAKWMRQESQKVRALSRLLFSARQSAPATRGEIPSSVLVELEQGQTVADLRFEADGLACTGDFAVISGHELRLYTVAAKAVDSARHQVGAEFTTQRGAIRADWAETLDRIAFRMLVTQACLLNYRVIPFLVAPCSGAIAEIEGLPTLVDRLTAGDREAEALSTKGQPLASGS